MRFVDSAGSIQTGLDALAAKALLQRLKGEKDGCYDELVEMNVIQHVPADFAGRRILDAGAYLGTFTALAVSHGAAFVLALEANPDNFAKLSANVKGMPQVTAMNVALTDGDPPVVYVSERGPISKVKPQGPGPGVPAKALAEFLRFFPDGDDNLVLKIDIEGSEFDVFAEASRASVRRFETIFAEFHGEPPPSLRNLEELKEHVAGLGYRMEGEAKPQYWWDWDRDGKVIGCKRLPIETIKYKREG